MKGGRLRQKSGDVRRQAAEALAVAALAYLASDAERLGRFLAATGIGPERIREAAREPNFLAGVLDHFATDEELLLAFARQAGIEPTEIERAHNALGGTWDRDIP
jgi:Protein of unknown function (DUF3572)